MTPDEYREAINRLGLAISTTAGPAIGVSRTTSMRYADRRGDGPPETVAILLRLMLERRE